MNDDDQVNAEELAESRKQREAAQAAKTPELPPVSGDASAPPSAPMQWVRHVKKWLGVPQSSMQLRHAMPLKTLRALKKKPVAL